MDGLTKINQRPPNDGGCGLTHKPQIFRVKYFWGLERKDKTLLVAPCSGRAIDSCAKNGVHIKHDIILVAGGAFVRLTARLVAVREDTEQLFAPISHVFHVSEVNIYRLPGTSQINLDTSLPTPCDKDGIRVLLPASVFDPDLLTTWHNQKIHKQVLLDGTIEKRLIQGPPPLESDMPIYQFKCFCNGTSPLTMKHNSKEPKYVHLEYLLEGYNITMGYLVVADKGRTALIKGRPESLDEIVSTFTAQPWSTADRRPLNYFTIMIDSIEWFDVETNFIRDERWASNGLCPEMAVRRSRFWDSMKSEWR